MHLILASEIADQLRSTLVVLAKSNVSTEDVARQLDRFGWELDALREIVRGADEPREGASLVAGVPAKNSLQNELLVRSTPSDARVRARGRLEETSPAHFELVEGERFPPTFVGAGLVVLLAASGRLRHLHPRERARDARHLVTT